MKINFTKKQFRKLLDLVFLGDTVVNGYKLADEEIKEYKDIQQYVYSFAKEFGFEDLIEFNKEHNMYFETRKHDESDIYELIKEYDEEVFWQEISAKLAQRDVVKDNKDTIDEMDHKEVISLIWEREEDYDEEFYENGLDNVNVDMKDKK